MQIFMQNQERVMDKVTKYMAEAERMERELALSEQRAAVLVKRLKRIARDFHIHNMNEFTPKSCHACAAYQALIDTGYLDEEHNIHKTSITEDYSKSSKNKESYSELSKDSINGDTTQCPKHGKPMHRWWYCLVCMDVWGDDVVKDTTPFRKWVNSKKDKE